MKNFTLTSGNVTVQFLIGTKLAYVIRGIGSRQTRATPINLIAAREEYGALLLLGYRKA